MITIPQEAIDPEISDADTYSNFTFESFCETERDDIKAILTSA